MAGPGGGPPRRSSHTKSRKGCSACKRRHIRCDEGFPQCANCTKHKIRCPYTEQGEADSQVEGELLWTPEIRTAIEQWKKTKVFPFPQLGVYPTPDPHRWEMKDLRLIYHLADLTCQLENIGANKFTIWTAEIPKLIGIAARHDFVMFALLAFSAMHVAHVTGCPKVGVMEGEYRSSAFSGLHAAIATFSAATSDAILAGSLLLSWQATEWRAWTQLMQGTSTVIDAMSAWSEQSIFKEFIDNSKTFPTMSPVSSPSMGSSKRLGRVPIAEDDDCFQAALQNLQMVESYLKQAKDEAQVKMLGTLISFLKGSRKLNSSYSLQAQFERLRPLRGYVFFASVEALRKHGAKPTTLVTVAQYYTVSMLMERFFPEIGSAYFGSLCLGPIQHIARRLHDMSLQFGDPNTTKALAFLKKPVETVVEFRDRNGYSPAPPTPSFPNFANMYEASPVQAPLPLPLGTPQMGVPMPSPIVTTTLPYMDSPSSIPASLSYMESPSLGTYRPRYSHSTDSLGLIGADSSGRYNAGTGRLLTADSAAPYSNSAISPLSMSPPLMTSGAYLNIPSPGYAAGGLSPASSTFESSIAFSEPDEPGNFDFQPSSDMYNKGYSTTGPVHPASPYAYGLSAPNSRSNSLLPATEMKGTPASPCYVPLPESPNAGPNAFAHNSPYHRHARSNSSAFSASYDSYAFGADDMIKNEPDVDF